MVVKIVICIMFPLIMTLSFLDKKGRLIISGILFGSLLCIAASYINAFVFNSFNISYFYLTTTIAPITEELLKFIPVLACALFLTKEKARLVPFAFAVGVGFAIVENSYMLVQNSENATAALLLIRGIGAGLMHAMATSMAAHGLSHSLEDKRTAVLGTLSAFFLATMYHGAYNCLVQAENLRYLGILLPIFTYGAVALIYNKQSIKKFLTEK